MAQLVGKYQHVSNAPEFEDYLRAVQVPEEHIKSAVAAKPILIVSEAGDKWTITSVVDEKETSNTFKFGEAFDEKVADIILKSVAKRDGNKITTVATSPKGKIVNKVLEFTADGINVTLTDTETGVSGSQVFKRI